MAIANPTDPGSSGPFSCLEDDVQDRGAALAVLLAEHPAQLTLAELVRQLTENPDDFGQRDAVERAVRDLVGIGLLHRQGSFIVPSRIALYYERPEEAA